MTRYEKALEEANRFLGEADSVNPQMTNLLNQKKTLELQISRIDKQRSPLVLRLQDLNKAITKLGGDITV
jgi:chaperonin cofactor prefoldin